MNLLGKRTLKSSKSVVLKPIAQFLFGCGQFENKNLENWTGLRPQVLTH